MKKLSCRLVKCSGLAGALLLLCACSANETGYTKKASPWDHIRNTPQTARINSDAAPIELELSQQPGDMQAEPVQVEPVTEMVEEAPTEEVSEVSSIGGGILEMPADYYTVQLMASVDIDRVYKFADQNQLSIKYIVPTYRDGLLWHVLLLDVYPDRASATEGKDEVEAKLRTQPWIRTVGSIQKLMR